MVFEIIISMAISLVYLGVIYVSSKMVRGSLGLEYFYVRGATVWEIDRIHEKHWPLLSKKIGWLNIIFASFSAVIFPCMLLGIFDFMGMLMIWFGVAFLFVVVFLIIFEIFARKKKERSS